MSLKTNMARKFLKAKETAREGEKIPSADIKSAHMELAVAQFDPLMMVDLFPGPALLVDGNMSVSHHNDLAISLLDPLAGGQTFLTSLILRCLSSQCPDSQKITLEEGENLRHYDLYSFPVKTNKADTCPLVFLFGRETSVEHNLTDALVDSRQMFKDLVSCSTDFAWETDSKGNFIYASPNGILGYSAIELNGKSTHAMIIGAEGENPFTAHDKIEEMELWLSRADGDMACLLISALPSLDSQGNWKGARGVCRDVSGNREREAVLRRIRKREHILDKIIATIRDITNPAHMLETALMAIMESINADFGCIIQKTPAGNGRFKAEIKQEAGNLVDPDQIMDLCQMAIKCWQQPRNNKINITQFADYNILIGITSHHGTDNGALFLLRHKGTDWQEDDRSLFTGITDHLGIAIEQTITHKELEKRAFSDELTGLLNRRAFNANVKKRLKNQIRSHKTCALLYIDLDNFKNVNDSKGHAVGDQILQELSKIIRNNIRIGDYAARIGGDEFSIWLDDISVREAESKTRAFVQQGVQLARIAQVSGPQLSLSVGIAISPARDKLTLEQLMENADEALYEAKARGKATCVTYDPEHNYNISSESQTNA